MNINGGWSDSGSVIASDHLGGGSNTILKTVVGHNTTP